MRIPNFLIIGAQRSGTTSLCSYLTLNRQIFLAQSPNEPKFFSREQEYVKGEEYYCKKYFATARGFLAAGEKSTEYMENVSVAERIYKFNPHMKLVYMLRHPVERAISNYWFSRNNKLEPRHINEALSLELEKYLKNPVKITRLYDVQPHAYITRGLYYDNLKLFYEVFPRKNIFCIVFEEFTADTQKVIKTLFSFLGVGQIDLSGNKIKPQRATERKENINSVLYKELEQFFIEKNKKIHTLTGKDVWQFWL